MTELPRLDRTISSVSTLAKQGGDLRVREATPAECLNMVWPLTLAANYERIRKLETLDVL